MSSNLRLDDGIFTLHFSSTTMSEFTEETKKRGSALVETKDDDSSAPTAKKSRLHHQQPNGVLSKAVQCTTAPPGTRLNIQALKNNVTLNQILTEMLENNVESDEKKEDPALLKANRRFTSEQAMRDIDEPEEEEEEPLTMEVIPTAFSALKPPPTSPSKSASLRASYHCPLFSAPFRLSNYLGSRACTLTE